MQRNLQNKFEPRGNINGVTVSLEGNNVMSSKH